MPAPARCDGFATCGAVVPDHESELRLRAMGWHHYHGPSFAGARDIIDRWICPKCLSKQRMLKGEVLDGQEGLF